MGKEQSHHISALDLPYTLESVDLSDDLQRKLIEMYGPMEILQAPGSGLGFMYFAGHNGDRSEASILAPTICTDFISYPPEFIEELRQKGDVVEFIYPQADYHPEKVQRDATMFLSALGKKLHVTAASFGYRFMADILGWSKFNGLELPINDFNNLGGVPQFAEEYITNNEIIELMGGDNNRMKLTFAAKMDHDPRLQQMVNLLQNWDALFSPQGYLARVRYLTHTAPHVTPLYIDGPVRNLYWADDVVRQLPDDSQLIQPTEQFRFHYNYPPLAGKHGQLWSAYSENPSLFH